MELHVNLPDDFNMDNFLKGFQRKLTEELAKALGVPVSAFEPEPSSAVHARIARQLWEPFPQAKQGMKRRTPLRSGEVDGGE